MTLATEDANADWHEICLRIALATGLALVVVTEGLGLVHQLTPGLVWGFWAAWAGGIAFFVWHKHASFSRRTASSQASRSRRTLLVAISAIVVLVGITAWCAPPNTTDSMNYHMSRVVNWQQQRSVADYPAGYLPQLYHPPFAEFAILNVQLMVGSDRLANAVQLLAMIGTLVTISLVAKYLGVNALGQLLSATFVAGLPVGILEASGTQNDYVAALWLAALAVFVLKLWQSPDAHWTTYAWAGVGLGLALNTKGTSYIFAAPLLIALVAVSVFKKRRRAEQIALIGLIGAIALAINVPYYARNIALFASPLGPGIDEASGSTYFVEAVTWSTIASNLVRELALHLGSQNVYLNQWLFGVIVRLHDWLGISVNSPLTTWRTTEFTRTAIQLSLHDSRGGNLIPLALVLASVGLAWRSGQLKRFGNLTLYVLAHALAILLFCALLKWQPWNSRLDLPWFVLSAPIVGAALSDRFPRKMWLVLCVTVLWLSGLGLVGAETLSGRRLLVAGLALAVMVVIGVLFFRSPSPRLTWLKDRLAVSGHQLAQRFEVNSAYLFGMGLLLSGLPWALANETRPLIGDMSVLSRPRVEQYFVNAPELEAPYVQGAARVRETGCAHVGLLTTAGNWDYPMWVLLRDGSSDVSIKNVVVPNLSERLVGPTFVPCAIVALHPVNGDELVVTSLTYYRLWESKVEQDGLSQVAVFLPRGASS